MNDTLETIYIATKNIDRFKSIYRTLRLLFKKAFLTKIDDSIPDCQESGANSKKNAEIKAKYYYKFTQGSTLAEDDSVYFDGLADNKQPGHLVRRKKERKTNYWEGFIAENQLRSGAVHKHFCLIEPGGKVRCCKVVIPFFVRKPKTALKLINSLNNFIVPIGFNKSIAEMNDADKKKFSRVYMLRPLSELFGL